MTKLTTTRRHFLQGSAAAGAATLSPLASVRAFAEAASGEQTIINAAHWGPLAIRVKDGKIVSSGPALPDQPVENSLQTVVADQVYTPIRIKQPMVRKGFWENRAHPQQPDGKRGNDEWIPISWDDAYDLITAQMQRIRKDYGSKAIFAGSYGWRSSGALHKSPTLLQRFMNITGGFVGHLGDYSTGAAQVIMPHVVGSIEVYEQQTSWEVVFDKTDVVVFWSANPMNTSKIAWAASDCQGRGYVKRLKDSGKTILVIDPLRNETAQMFGDKARWIAPRPSTDVALMLGIAHEMMRQNLHDQDFLKNYTTGFERFAAYLNGEEDGTPKTAQWAENISGVPAETIAELARTLTGGRSMLMAGWGMQRQHHGEQAHWMLVTLACMIGQIGLPGGGFGLSYHYSNGGVPTHTSGIPANITPVPAAVPGNDWHNPVADLAFPVARIADALHEPGKTINYNGGTITLPEIKMIWWCGGNPFCHHQNTNRLRAGWQKPEFIVVSDPYWTPTAKHADLVLPITTSYERNDMSITGDYSNMHLVPMKQVVPPQHQARDDFDVFRDLAARVGLENAYTEGRSKMQWLKYLYDGAQENGRQQRIAMPRFQQFWRENKIFLNPLKDKDKYWVRYADYRKDPLLNPLGTPSGKFEIYCKTVADMHYDDCPGHPTWMEPVEYLGNASEAHPLHMLSPHTAHRLHSQLCYSSLRQRYAIANREPVWINPEDAKARGIKDGDLVRVFNDRGQVLAGALVTDNVRPRVIALHEGAWYDPADGSANALCKNGSPNVLSVDMGTSSLAQGNTGHTALVQIEKYTGAAPELTAFTPPKGAA